MIRQQHEHMEPDGHFLPGKLPLLAPCNTGRALDGRRTPGYIESFDPNSALFI